MKTNKLIVTALMIVLVLAVGLFTSAFTTPQEEIIATWVSQDDPLYKIEFTDDGLRKEYYEGILQDTYYYFITNICKGQTLQNEELFLKTVDIDTQNEITCDILEAVNNENSGILSITTERGKLLLFNKE